MLESIENAMNNTENTIETRLLQYFIIGEFAWAVFNTVFSMATGLPRQTIMTFLAVTVALPVFLSIGYFTHRERFFSEVFFIVTFLAVPVVWYNAGGNSTAASVIFVAELQLFAMCLRGRKQAIFIVLSMFSTSLLYALSARFPEQIPLYMTKQQISMENIGIGASTSIIITFVLLKQKREYMKERQRAFFSESELIRSNQLQKNFLANMSHEIRSPLGIVLGFNTLISETDDIEQIHEYSENITNAGKTLQTVINDILDYSKIESGKLDIIDVDYSVNDLLSEIKSEIELKCEEKGLRFDLKADYNLPDYLRGDNIRIKQCLLNVLSNAVKYTDKGFVSFEIVCEEKYENGDCLLKFKISDTGRGISEEAMPKLFDSFQRLDEGHNRGIEGTGLGLAITKSLMDEMGGSIEVESAIGVGTTFTLRLRQAEGIKISKIFVPKHKASLQGVKVLAIDDTPMNLSLVQKMLLKEQVEVTTGKSGQECLEAILEEKFDVILLDHMMPKMDGIETYQKMKKNPGLNEDTPVVMLTANAMAGAAKEYTDLGFDGYLSKPINQKKLIRMIIELTHKE